MSETNETSANPALLHNFRDLGGIQTQDGKTIRAGKIFRSAAPLKPNSQLVGWAKNLGIETVIDLRDLGEVEQTTTGFRNADLTVIHQPVFSNELDQLRFKDLRELYQIMTGQEKYARQLAGAFQKLNRSASSGVLIHCTAGKDRTGLVSAISLTVLGASAESVLADYGQSQELLGQDYLDDLFGERLESIPGFALHRAVSAPPELLAETLDQLEAKYGGIADFLLNFGVSETELEDFKTKMIE